MVEDDEAVPQGQMMVEELGETKGADMVDVVEDMHDGHESEVENGGGDSGRRTDAKGGDMVEQNQVGGSTTKKHEGGSEAGGAPPKVRIRGCGVQGGGGKITHYFDYTPELKDGMSHVRGKKVEGDFQAENDGVGGSGDKMTLPQLRNGSG